eukprot:GHVU01214239.1.p1 GENE.GHVU01214239.1~~GHVU01214239.1.p1  ORF type:complete len:280 (+),score=9.69 GHVU01214239.1:50-889(+)
MLLLTVLAALLCLSRANISGTNPPTGSCLCFSGASVNIRNGPCGTSIGSGSTGQCFVYPGGNDVCSLSGTTYHFFEFQYCGNVRGWSAGDYLTIGSASSCTPTAPQTGLCGGVQLVTRSGWGARPPTSTTAMSLPVSRLFIHHGTGSACTTQATCSSIVRGYQNYHMDSNGWSDIAYNYLVGEDGRVYEGRGWARQGAHTSGYNSIAVAICFIGDFTSRLPNTVALTAARNLIQCAKDQGVLTGSYGVWGHRDGSSTACPGNTLYGDVVKWYDYGCGTP